MSNAPTPQAPFASRHIGLSDDDRTLMLKRIGFTSMEDLIDSVVPRKIRRRTKMKLSSPLSEEQVLEELANIAKKNKVKTSLIGMGYNNCFTPPVIVRNVLENPAWYTPYTPYQPEISQGRLEALLNFQTMIIELTGMGLLIVLSLTRQLRPQRLWL